MHLTSANETCAAITPLNALLDLLARLAGLLLDAIDVSSSNSLNCNCGLSILVGRLIAGSKQQDQGSEKLFV